MKRCLLWAVLAASAATLLASCKGSTPGARRHRSEEGFVAAAFPPAPAAPVPAAPVPAATSPATPTPTPKAGLAPALAPPAPLDETHPDAPKSHTRWLVAREGKGFAEEIDGQLVIHLKGSHYEMGFQMGKMLPEQCREDVEFYLKDFAYDQHRTLPELLGIYAQAEPFIPQGFKEELKGLADGAGIPLDEVVACHIVPELYHCSGSAAWGEATIDGKLYHHRSLDYALDIGKKKRVQENAALLLFAPDDGIPHAVVGWVGTLGCVSGMSERGISIGEMGSKSKDESFAGIPMWFLLRQVLQTAGTLQEGIDLFRHGPRTCGYNFILADGKIPEAVAIEVTRSKIAVFRAHDSQEDVAPHWSLRNMVRRVNHFVAPELAATQREVYDPHESESASWMGYELIGNCLEQGYGTISAQTIIGLCRMYPPKSPCLHQAVFSPSDARLWVANAKDPQKVEYAGAQNQYFHPYDLKELLARDPATLKRRPAHEVGRIPAPPTGPPPVVESGTSRSRALDWSSEPDERLRAALQRFDTPVEEFAWKRIRLSETERVEATELQYPSPVATRDVENNTVYAHYYRPKSAGRHPAVVVLHHLGGSFDAEEMIARQFATEGIAALMVWMPYYGKRMPHDPARRPSVELLSDDAEATITTLRQGICDIRRAGDWLAQRPEVDPEHVGVMGISLGSIVGSVVAGVDHHFSRVGLIIGGGDLPAIVFNARETKELRETLQKKGITADDLRRDWWAIDPLTYAVRIDPGCVLMLNAKKDEVIPKESTTKLWEALRRPQILWYDATHYSIALFFPDLIAKMAAHFKK